MSESNKSFKLGAYDCEYPWSPPGGECWHYYIPPHKKKVKIV